MKVLLGQIAADARGTLGGVVFSRNRYGSYVRSHVSPVQPRTSRQLAQRESFTFASKSWRLLTAAQREAWRTFAATQTFENIFGLSKRLSGQALYMKLNLGLVTCCRSDPDAECCPNALTDPPTSLNTCCLSNFEVECEDLAATWGPDGDDNCCLAIYATAPHSPGRKFVEGEYRLIAVVDSGTSADLVDPWEAVFGPLPDCEAEDECHLWCISFAARFISKCSGSMGSPLRADVCNALAAPPPALARAQAAAAAKRTGKSVAAHAKDE